MGVFMDSFTDEIKKVTFRTASSFGFSLANSVGETMEEDNVPPSHWPVRFPLTLKHITKMPEVGGNSKVAKKIAEAAKAMWQDMRSQAIEIEIDIKLHPELYEPMEDHSFNPETHKQEWAWRHLSVSIEQLAGNIFVTEFGNEEMAKRNIYSLISARKLKEYMTNFEDDYKNFIDEVRETIRERKEIKASTRLELICSLNTNTKRAMKLKDKKVISKKVG
jgi:hypothetical protein